MGIVNDNNRKWWILGTVCFSLLMIVLDGNVVNLAIPSIIKSFDASISQIEWVTNAYLLVFAVFLITFGRLGDEFGRKKLFIIGLTVFVLGSMLCGISNSIEQLILFRAIQGLGGAAMMPATLSLITVHFKPKERGVALGLWGAIAGFSVVLGPVIGGYLTENGLGNSLNTLIGVTEFWRYVFFINLPIGLLAILATIILVPESKDKSKKHYIDFLGILLSSLTIFTLTFALIEGTKYGWWRALDSPLQIGSLSVIPLLFLTSFICGTLFFLWEKSKKTEPIVNLELFKDRNYKIGNITTMILSFAMMGSFFLLPLFLQLILGFSPAKTGQILLPLAITIILIAPMAGKLADKYGPRYLASGGLMIMASGLYLMSYFTVNTTTKDLIVPFIIVGFGMGLIQAPVSSAVLRNVPEDKAGGASGVVTTIRQIGAVMGIAILGAVLQSQMLNSFNSKINQINEIPNNVKNTISNQVRGGNAFRSNSDMQEQLSYVITKQINQTPPSADLKISSKEQQQKLIEKFRYLGLKIGYMVKSSFVESMNSTFKVASLIALIGAVVALFLSNSNKKKLKEVR